MNIAPLTIDPVCLHITTCSSRALMWTAVYRATSFSDNTEPFWRNSHMVLTEKPTYSHEDAKGALLCGKLGKLVWKGDLFDCCSKKKLSLQKVKCKPWLEIFLINETDNTLKFISWAQNGISIIQLRMIFYIFHTMLNELYIPFSVTCIDTSALTIASSCE